LEGTSGPVPIQIYAQPKAKDNVNDPLPKFFELYSSCSCVGSFLKESPNGKNVLEWQKLEDAASSKPEKADIAATISAIMAPKDAEELVCALAWTITNEIKSSIESHPDSV
jgi:nucleosome binding factor SPN SPT16 subunit